MSYENYFILFLKKILTIYLIWKIYNIIKVKIFDLYIYIFYLKENNRLIILFIFLTKKKQYHSSLFIRFQ